MQSLAALAACPASAQEALKGLVAGMSDPSPVKYEVNARDLSIGITDSGHIVALKLGSHEASVPFHACTYLASCTQEGPVAHRTLDSGGVEFSRIFVQQGTRFQCTVVDRFTPNNSSVRWEVEIVGAGDPFTAPIETQLSYLNPSKLSFWTAWDAPPEAGAQPVQSETFNNLLDAFQQKSDAPSLQAAADEAERLWPRDKWSDPLVPAPFADLDLRFGGYLHMHNAFSIPIATVMDASTDRAISLVQSPETDLLDIRLKTSLLGDANLVRTNHRISSGRPVRIAMDLVAHAADWRAGLGWMVDRYPSYFESPNRSAYQLDGCGSYAGNEGDIDAGKLQKMAYSLNWNARFDWPYQGMSVPPVKADVSWSSWYQKPASLKTMDRYDEKMEEAGVRVLDYFVTTEAGNYIQNDPPSRKAKADSELWQDGNDFVHYQIPDAVIRDREGKILFSNWFSNVVLDPGEPCWQKSLLDQAVTLVKQLPHSSGICIDRMDWLTVYNLHRDDGVSWIDGRPARSLLNSWKETLSKLAAILHPANKFIFANTLVTRIDCCSSLDGFYDEMGDYPSSLNLCSLMAVRKPAIAWTRDINTLRPDPDAFFQRHLHLGVFPTVPMPGADHTIPEDSWVDQCYLDYGPLLRAMRGKRWVLKPHAVSVDGAAAHANLFRVPGGYALPITFACNVNQVAVTLGNFLDAGEHVASMTIIHPGEANGIAAKWQSSGDATKITVPVQRGCAMVKIDCSAVPAHRA